LKDHVAEYTPERCSEITWIPAEQIEGAARLYAATKPACIGPGMAGASQAVNAFDLNRALASLAAITGNLEIQGGNPNFRSPTGRRSCYGPEFSVMANLPPEQANKRIGLDVFPIITRASGIPEQLWKAILEKKPYPVKGLGLFAGNAMCSYANSRDVEKALAGLDFLFAVDYFQTPTTAMADVVLPPAHWTERNDVEDLMMMNHVFCQEKLETIGMTFDEFREKGCVSIPLAYKGYEKYKGFKTPSGTGKVDLYSEAAEKDGASPLPVFREPPQSPVSTPDLYREFPLILTTGGRNVVYYHSAHRNIPSLRKLSPDPLLDINPETAESLNIVDGEWVRLKTMTGEVEIRARIEDGLHLRVVHAPQGYWYGVVKGWERVNINQVTGNESQCRATGSVQTRALLCRVEKIAS
jgi:anaerobic selenocysteine-containing dehydrogenase